MQPLTRNFSAGLLSGFILLGMAYPTLAYGDNRDVVHNDTNSVVVSSDNRCVRTKWSSGNDECNPPAAAPVQMAQQRVVIGKEDRTVYFGFNRTSLTPDSQAKLNSLAEKLKSDRQVRQARIVGYADRIGRPGYNQKLSEKRAQVVRDYLISRGYINARVAETRWFGAEHPATHCPDGMKRPELIDCLQKDRRVEAEIDYYPTGQASGR